MGGINGYIKMLIVVVLIMERVGFGIIRYLGIGRKMVGFLQAVEYWATFPTCDSGVCDLGISL